MSNLLFDTRTVPTVLKGIITVVIISYILYYYLMAYMRIILIFLDINITGPQPPARLVRFLPDHFLLPCALSVLGGQVST